jgi:hypothetical protein
LKARADSNAPGALGSAWIGTSGAMSAARSVRSLETLQLGRPTSMVRQQHSAGCAQCAAARARARTRVDARLFDAALWRAVATFTLAKGVD